MSLERLQKVAMIVAIVCGLLGLLASTGRFLLPRGSPTAAWILHPLLLLLGGGGGVATLLRHREIDRQRWQVVEDPALTSGEREYAHREAERLRRVVGTVFLTAPLAFGYWMANQFSAEGRVTAADFLILTPLVGYFLGFLLGRLRIPERPS